MIKRYIARAAGEGPYHDTMPDERVRAWGKNFPPNVARRMTRLGLMLGEAMRDFPIGPDDAVVYATTFSETVATERYLGSFPTASPLFFQTSIHPSAIEQVLINRACPVRELTPLAGQRHLAAQAALAALLTPTARVLLTGGEEIGAWLRELDAASERRFRLRAGPVPTTRRTPSASLCWTGRERDPGSVARTRAPTVPLPDVDSVESLRVALRCSEPCANALPCACRAPGGGGFACAGSDCDMKPAHPCRARRTATPVRPAATISSAGPCGAMPDWFNRLGMRVGTTLCLWTLRRQRAASREYLRLALGREPRVERAVGTFFRVHQIPAAAPVNLPRRRTRKCVSRRARATNCALGSRSGRPALYGTMHVGRSDLMGFFLGHLGERVHMIRKQVGNSEDTRRLARRYERSVTFIWINDWSRLILAMNDALRAGRSLAMQCDRPEYSSKHEGFRFLGERRMFPFTIYHLAIMHGMPVVLSYAVPDGRSRSHRGPHAADVLSARGPGPAGEFRGGARAFPVLPGRDRGAAATRRLTCGLTSRR